MRKEGERERRERKEGRGERGKQNVVSLCEIKRQTPECNLMK
jgi:hypothetical protein